MATLKDVKNKINAVRKTKQITKAMNMVAASKLRGAQSKMDAFRPYAAKFAEVLGSLSEKAGEEASPLLVPRETVRKVHLIVCSSDRGLCGGFNSNLTNRAGAFVRERDGAGMELSFTAFGKKARDWCRKKGHPMADEYLGIMGGNFEFNVASKSGRKLIQGFLEERYDEVHIVYSEFQSMARQVAKVRQLLPIPPLEPDVETAAQKAEGPYLAEHIAEPSAEELLSEMLPKNVFVQIYSALLETSTSEHAARMAAMDNATKACNDMIESLTLLYNKARQAAITAELMDIVGGAEALKG